MGGSNRTFASIFLLVAFTFYTSVAAGANAGATSNNFIKTSCSTTAYPNLWITSLSARASTIQTSPKLLTESALAVTLDTTKSTFVMMLKLSQSHGMLPNEVAAMKDCMEVLSDSVEMLKKSLGEMYQPGKKDFGLMVNDVQTWVSAASTDEDTCTEGFSRDPKMKYVVRGKIVNVAHLTSNALSLINSYASLYG